MIRMTSTICSTGLKPGCCSSNQLNVCISESQINAHILNLHITWTDLSLKKCPLPIILVLAIIDSGLTWSDYVTRVGVKANSVLGFLQCNLKYCPPEIKTSCFKSLVTSILEYGCTSWFPCFQKDIYAKEMVHQRAARFIFNDYSYNTSVISLLNTLNWPIESKNIIQNNQQPYWYPSRLTSFA